MKRMSGLILVTLMLVAVFVSGCAKDSNQSANDPAKVQLAGAAVTGAQSGPLVVPAAPASTNVQTPLFQEKFTDASLANYDRASSGANTIVDLNWVVDGNRLLQKSKGNVLSDPGQQEMFISRQKGFANYTYSADIFQGDSVLAGLVFGSVDVANTYKLNFIPQSSTRANVFLFRETGLGKAPLLLKQIEGVTYNSTTWQHVSVTVVNGDIKVQVNTQAVAEVQDSTPAAMAKGGVGVFGSGSQSLAFANLTVVSAQAGR